MAVLVVDDDATVVNLVTAVLHRAGIDAEVAIDGPGALQRLGRGRYRAVLSDLTMPGMSGLQLLREARARGHALPFLIMTAYLPPETELALRTEPGVAGVLRKPFDIKRLVEQVRSLLQSAGPGPAAVELVATEAIADADAVMAAAGMAAAVPEALSTESVKEQPAEEPAEEPAEVPVGAPVEFAVEVAVDVAVDLAVQVTAGVAAASTAAVVELSRAPIARGEPTSDALLPLSLLEYVSARLRRQALIAQAERRAAALLARPAPRVREADLDRLAEPLREAEQGC